jgi:hypothetical protein
MANYRKLKTYAVIVYTFILILSLSIPTLALNVDQGNIKNITEQLTQYNRMSGENNEAAYYIKAIMQEYGLETKLANFSFETTTEGMRKNTSNVIGIKQGNSDQIIIIGAHYDTLLAKNPGADDNAAGVAVMLETARLFQNESLNRTIYFIAYSGEELGLRGSKNWLETNSIQKDNIVAVVNLDCVASGNELWMYTLNQHSWLLDVFPSKTNLGKHIDFITLASDEWSYWEENIPAIGLRDHGSHGFWDTPNDTVDKLNFTLAEECTEIIAIGLYNLSTTSDQKAPELFIEIQNGTVHYTVSEEKSTNIEIDGINLGDIESGKVTLPSGKHKVKVIAIDSIGNRVSEILFADIDDEYYVIPYFDGESEVNIPYKSNGHTGPLFTSLDYEISNSTCNVTVVGFIDDIRIEDLQKHYIILDSGNHTFKVAAYTKNGLIGVDDDYFESKKSFSRQKLYPKQENSSNLLEDFFDLSDRLNLKIQNIINGTYSMLQRR